MIQSARFKTKPTLLDIEEREAFREQTDINGEVVGDRVPRTPIRIANFSRLGCKIVSSHPTVAGRFVCLSILEFEFRGWVVWTSADGYGIDFAHPVPDLVVAYIFRTNHSQE